MISKPFSSAVPLLVQIEQAGYEAFFVGGSVRDYLLGRKIADVDIATSALPAELKQIFPKTADVGIEHGTILVHFKGVPYEITTFRMEAGYSDFRRPDEVSFIRSLSEDLERRDFTMNAIAMDKNGVIIDPFNGRADIEKKRIVTVGNPDSRFGEDALRMMRAVRFLSQLSFKIEEKTIDSLTRLSCLLEHIAIERKSAEFEKILQGESRSEALKVLVSTGMYKYLPGLNASGDGLLSLSNRLSISLGLEEMWTLLVFEIKVEPGSIESFLKGWKLPGQKIKKIKQLYTWLMYRLESKWTKATLYKAGLESAISIEKIYHCLFPGQDDGVENLRQTYNLLPIKTRAELSVTGGDLLSWMKREAGPWVRVAIEEIEMAVIDHKVENDPDKIKGWLIK